MAKKTETSTEQNPIIATTVKLVTAADGDTLYRDVYLRRAGELLSPLVSEAQYATTLKDQEQHARLLAQARASVGRRDWEQVRQLGASAAAMQRSWDAQRDSLAAAEAVYSAPPVAVDPLSAGLKGMSKRWSSAGAARAEVVGALKDLVRDDPPHAELYASRQRALEALDLPDATSAVVSDAAPAAAVELQALQALEKGDASALERLAESMVGRATGSKSAGPSKASGRVVVPEVLGEALPEGCVSRAGALGLERLEVRLASPALAAAISDFVERYALGASPATRDLASEGVARVTIAAEEAAIPPDVAAVFAQTIAVFALHVDVNSAGLRYVPVPPPREFLLLELHAEGEDPVTPLLGELGLERRRGLSRDDIEARLLKHGARILAEHLGLDPVAYRLVCVPPDVYVRVGRDRGWGALQQWTHFDGYQALAGGRLRALVGGNARYGGVFDLCSISRDDARENTFARFAVIHRERLGMRIG